MGETRQERRQPHHHQSSRVAFGGSGGEMTPLLPCSSSTSSYTTTTSRTTNSSSLSPTSIRILFTTLILLTAACSLANGLQCYTDIEGKTIVTCNEVEGFRTCFTKYNDSKYIPSAFPFGVLHQYQEAAVVGRGCSTKDKVFYKECETHSYGDSLEKMCFCSFKLCNGAPSNVNVSPIKLILVSLLASHLVLAYTNYFFCWVWDPWPSSKASVSVSSSLQLTVAGSRNISSSTIDHSSNCSQLLQTPGKDQLISSEAKSPKIEDGRKA